MQKPNIKGRWKACSVILFINTLLFWHSMAKIWFSVCSELCQFFFKNSSRVFINIYVNCDNYSAVTETGATQTMKTNQMAELEQ